MCPSLAWAITQGCNKSEQRQNTGILYCVKDDERFGEGESDRFRPTGPLGVAAGEALAQVRGKVLLEQIAQEVWERRRDRHERP